MDMDERPKSSDLPIDALEAEELDRYSLADLEDRIARLEAEIVRTRGIHRKKGTSQAAAEALFGKGQS